MQSFLDKIKGIFNKDNFGKIGVFFVENKRYFAAALLFVILVLVLTLVLIVEIPNWIITMWIREKQSEEDRWKT